MRRPCSSLMTWTGSRCDVYEIIWCPPDDPEEEIHVWLRGALLHDFLLALRDQLGIGAAIRVRESDQQSEIVYGPGAKITSRRCRGKRT